MSNVVTLTSVRGPARIFPAANDSRYSSASAANVFAFYSSVALCGVLLFCSG